MSSQSGNEPSERSSEIEDLVIDARTGDLINLKDLCTLCGNPVNKDAPDAWKRVTGYVGGPKKDSMRLREDTGYFAHGECVQRVLDGQTVDQPTLEEEIEDDGQREFVADDDIPW